MSNNESTLIDHDRLFLGLDIGGTRIKACVCTHGGDIVDKIILDTNAERGQEAVLHNVVQLIQAEQIRWGNQALTGIGIGICGPTNFVQGILITSPILVGWENVPLAAIIEAHCGVRPVIDNDANVAVLAETWIGIARGVSNVIGFTIGSGIGGGIIIQGDVYRGSHWFGGELGHMTVSPGGILCPCGNRGCLTMEASTNVVVSRYENLTKREYSNRGLAYWQILNKAEKAEAQAIAALMPGIEAIAIGIANTLNIFDPDYVVLFGGPLEAGDWLLESIRENVKKRAFPQVYDKTKITHSILGEFAGAIGAAKLAIQNHNSHLEEREADEQPG